MRKIILLTALIPFFVHCKQTNIDITQWRGNNRDGIYNETNLLKEWPNEVTQLLWYKKIYPWEIVCSAW